jgi:rhodanese-related sulfurtransferase
MSLKSINPLTLKRRLEEGSVALIDIREADEYARESIPGARAVPLSRFDSYDFARDSDRPVVFHCKSGSRTASHAGQLAAKTGDAYVLSGWLDGWKWAGLATKVDRSAPIDLMRQVQIATGSLVLLGVALALAVSPWFLALTVFVGAGLTMAGVTGFCDMARLLKVMPWNRRLFAH